MIQVRLKTQSLRETKASEFALRFCFGGAVTVLAWWVAKQWGPVIGGMFLAFPGIFPAGVSLVEKHKTQREAAEGLQGVRSARAQAAVEAAGASAGGLGLAAFGFVLWKGLPGHSLAATQAVALLAWAGVGGFAWWLRERM